MASAAQSRIKSISYAKYGYMFIAPFFLVYCFFQIWPLIYTFILSFKGNQSNNAAFVGLDNYTTILFGQGMAAGAAATKAEFLQALGNTFILWFGNFVPQILLSLLLAVWFTDAKVKLPGKGFFKVVMYMPNIITAASVAALYVNLFGDSEYYFVNSLLMNAGMADPIHFVTDPTISKIMVMFIQTWLWFGNTMIMLMSGIMGISPSLFEAADIDGANSTQQFFNITLPLLQPIMVYTLVTSMIGGLQMFDLPYLYHNGSNFSRSLETVAVYIYYNFNKGTVEQANYGYAGAASIIIFAITAILGSVTFYVNRDQDAAAKKKQRKMAEKQQKARAKQGGGLTI
ncbi:MAG: sugar ABC transporter permease [Oscillospiraceae bacterium]|nr:sugar ABC transporter permease [Oscillospiraceae bacterium]MDE5885240.1 sugar ABC transporter permease [Oscillospiraceae bacterium]